MKTGTTLRVHANGNLEYRRRNTPWYHWGPRFEGWDCRLVIPLPKGDRVHIHTVSKYGEGVRVTVELLGYDAAYDDWFPEETFIVTAPNRNFIDIHC